MDIVLWEQWPDIRDSLPTSEYLLQYLIPGRVKTLVHAPPGAGKTAFSWGAVNAMADGKPYLGLETSKVNTLLISVDMTIHGLKKRWGKHFVPHFDFICAPKCNITRDEFKSSKLHDDALQLIEKRQIQCVILDALGGFHMGRSARDDDTATEVDAAITAWFPNGMTIIEIGHDNKTRYGKDGEPLSPTDEDFMGSQLWRSNVQSQVHMWRLTDKVSKLHHSRSQVGEEMEDDIKLYIDPNGQADLFSDKKAQESWERLQAAIKELGIESLKPAEQNRLVAAHTGKDVRTIRRWRDASFDRIA